MERGREIFDGAPTRREEGRVVPVIEGPPDEIVQLKYIEEVRPRETGKRRVTHYRAVSFCIYRAAKITAPQPQPND
jgi:hypothetical protein